MNDDVTSKNAWDQSVNYIKNLREIVINLVGLDLKILVYPALLIYWAIIILAAFSLSSEKLRRVTKFDFHPIKLHFIWSILTILLSALSTSVKGQWNFFQDQWAKSLTLVAWRLNLCAWGLTLAACGSRSLVLEAWRLLLEACCLWPRPGARMLEAVACRSLMTRSDLLRSRNFL